MLSDLFDSRVGIMITLKQIKLLEEAVDEAEDWRGMHVGSAPDWFLDKFDDNIKAMRKAVEAVRRDRAELKAAKLALQYARS